MPSTGRTMQIGERDCLKGFTLLELIIVVSIIAALVTLAMPYYRDYVGESKNAVMRANLHTLRKALMEHKADLGYYPASLTDLVSPPPGKPRYLMAIPVDPEEGAPPDWGYNPATGRLDPRYDAY